MITLGKTEAVHISIYHIGYSSEGESSLFILHTLDKKVLYSVVIDCYEENCNETDRILEQWNLKGKVNLIIWSHPHEDHSLGMIDIIEKYSNDTTKICTANVFADYKQYTLKCQKIIEYLNSLNKGKHCTSRRKIIPLHHFPDLIDKVEFNGKNIIRRIEVICIAPFSYLGGMQGVNKTRDINQMGVACIIKVLLEERNVNFMFAADMDNASIELLNEESYDEGIPTVYNYIKIPHHGSKKTTNMIDFLNQMEEKSEYASTSIFKSKGLPVSEVMEKYKSVVKEIACTPNIEEENYGTGIIHLDYNLNELSVSKEYEGTACVLK